MSAGLESEFTFGRPQGKRREGRPFRILVMGDFSGRTARSPTDTDLARRPVIPVDVDNREAVLTRLSPRVSLPPGEGPGAEPTVEFTSLDDFHPDWLYDHLEVFRALRDLRRRLLDPATFQQAAAELRGPPSGAPAPEERPAPEEDDSGTLERLLGRAPATGGEASPARRAGLGSFIGRIVGPHIVPDAPRHQSDLVASVDRATSAEMRRVLRHPDLRRIWAAWLGLEALVTGLTTGEDLSIHLLDVTKDELAADSRAGGEDPTSGGLYRKLVDQGAGTAGGEPWSLIVGNYTFAPSGEDISLLASLGITASQAGGPFLAEASPRILGCRSLAESPEPGDWRPEPADALRWQALRKSPLSAWIGLALPRVLLRLPYGPDTEEIDRFDFEEIDDEHDHGAWHWGNPAFALALLIGRAFTARGWSMRPGDVLDVPDLPAHTLTVDGEKKLVPCAEVFLPERAAEVVLARGLMPLMSVKNRNAARLLRFQSISDPPAPLSGPWG